MFVKIILKKLKISTECGGLESQSLNFIGHRVSRWTTGTGQAFWGNMQGWSRKYMKKSFTAASVRRLRPQALAEEKSQGYSLVCEKNLLKSSSNIWKFIKVYNGATIYNNLYVFHTERKKWKICISLQLSRYF